MRLAPCTLPTEGAGWLLGSCRAMPHPCLQAPSGTMWATMPWEGRQRSRCSRRCLCRRRHPRRQVRIRWNPCGVLHGFVLVLVGLCRVILCSTCAFARMCGTLARSARAAGCKDENAGCPGWAEGGECQNNPGAPPAGTLACAWHAPALRCPCLPPSLPKEQPACLIWTPFLPPQATWSAPPSGRAPACSAAAAATSCQRCAPANWGARDQCGAGCLISCFLGAFQCFGLSAHCIHSSSSAVLEAVSVHAQSLPIVVYTLLFVNQRMQESGVMQ